MSAPLLSCQSISKSYASKQLFKRVSLSVFQGDRIGMIGPNGSGKSTLLKMLARLETPDEGSISSKRSLRIGYVPQDSLLPDQSIEEILLEAFTDADSVEIHDRYVAVNILLSKMNFPSAEQNARTLSGGWKKRLEIAREVIKNPDLLLLDEPTNHLDLEGIEWLEDFLSKQKCAYIVISHDRYFLQNVTSRIIELNKSYPNGLFSIEGSYNNFIEKRLEFLEGQQQYERALLSKARREIEWLKRTPQARTTKSSARIQEAGRLLQELSDVKSRNKQTTAQIDFSASDRQTRKLIAVKNVAKAIGERTLFSGVAFVLSPGMRLGIVGTNGSGKSTLLKILEGSVQPDQGTIKYADGVNIVYFDQHRMQLPLNLTLRQALSQTGEHVTYQGKSIHVSSWAKRFLFDPERLELPLSQFSGGERARILIARLMLQPADVLLLDEPTNDLDIPTLEVLEESLQEFPGAIVLITHDRYMLDRLCNVVLGLGTGCDDILFADYQQWEAVKQQNQPKLTSKKQKEATKNKESEKNVTAQKLSFKEQREWDQIEGHIHTLEAEINSLNKQLEDPVISQDAEKLQAVCETLSSKQHQLDQLFARWQELDNKVKPKDR